MARRLSPSAAAIIRGLSSMGLGMAGFIGIILGGHVEEYREELSWRKITKIHIDDYEEEGMDRESGWEEI